MVNFDLISQAREKLGMNVNRLSVLLDLTPNNRGVAEKDFRRLKWKYIQLNQDEVKYGRSKGIPTKDLRCCWKAGNVSHYYIYEDVDGKPRSLNFNGYIASGIDPTSLDERFLGRDIRAYNEGAKPQANMLMIGVALLTLGLGLLLGVLLGPSIMGAIHA